MESYGNMDNPWRAWNPRSAAVAQDVGTGSGALVPHLLAAGAQSVLGTDLSAAALAAAAGRCGVPPPGNPPENPLGNAPSRVDFWRGDVGTLPAYQGPFQAAFLSGVLHTAFDQARAREPYMSSPEPQTRHRHPQ